MINNQNIQQIIESLYNDSLSDETLLRAIRIIIDRIKVSPKKIH